MRDEPAIENWSAISASDPLNLVGIVTPGPRVPAKRANRVLYLNGRPVASREAGEVRWRVELNLDRRLEARRLLTLPGALRRHDAPALLDPLRSQRADTEISPQRNGSAFQLDLNL